MVTTNRFVVYVSAACLLWLELFLLLGAGPGRSWYEQTSQVLLGDGKGGVPVIHLAVPIFLAGSFASLLWISPSVKPPQTSEPSFQYAAKNIWLPSWGQRWFHRLYNVEGDCNVDSWALSIIAIPSVAFVSMTIYRHMHEKELSLDHQVLITSNAFGFVAEVVGSILLVPVARFSPLLQVVGWIPARAARLHMWAGRVFILASVIHGFMHIFRWLGLSKEKLMTMIVPPASCWTWDNKLYNSMHPSCLDQSTDCTCYAIFRNMTGFGALLALLILLVTSLHTIRRKFYLIFYFSHIIAAPLAIILVILHWNRSILYMGPSLLYYAATSVPTFIESRLKRIKGGSVKLVKVEQIFSVPEKNKELDGILEAKYVSLTFEGNSTSMQQYQPGYCVQLLAPEISSIPHPFTINTVPGKANQLRVILKVIGKFTSDLSRRLAAGAPNHGADALFPRLELNGYMGTSNRVAEVLRHDVAVMIAGGIGITPYLSLLGQVQQILSQSPPDSYLSKRIVLIWICRDPNLVQYVNGEYFQPLLTQQCNRSDVKIKIIVYNTGDVLSADPSYTSDDNTMVPAIEEVRIVQARAAPFAPSRFAAGQSQRISANILCFVAFTGISWTGLATVWQIFTLTQDSQGIALRFGGLAAILAVAAIGGLLVNLLAGLCQNMEDEGEHYVAPLLATAGGRQNVEARGGVEMSSVVDENYDPESNDTRTLCHIGLEEKQGRPSIHEMLKFVDNGRNPALFTCGPVGLMEGIRRHTEERCLLRLQQCMNGASHQIALYEEAFGM